MLTGERPSPAAAKTFDVALILHADHEMNASTFTARVIASTLSDMHSAITGAIGALKGPLHGGANEQVMHLLEAIPDGASVEDEIHARLERKERIMGFGHRVYKTWDPRAVILKRFSRSLAEESSEPRWFEMSEAIEKTVVGEKGLYPNVDFYSASTYHYLGIETGLFTPIFAMSRVVGWAAHVIEQHSDNRLIRPSSEYVGPAADVRADRAPLPGRMSAADAAFLDAFDSGQPRAACSATASTSPAWILIAARPRCGDAEIERAADLAARTGCRAVQPHADLFWVRLVARRAAPAATSPSSSTRGVAARSGLARRHYSRAALERRPGGGSTDLIAMPAEPHHLPRACGSRPRVGATAARCGDRPRA